jgi:hypothetical protein
MQKLASLARRLSRVSTEEKIAKPIEITEIVEGAQCTAAYIAQLTGELATLANGARFGVIVTRASHLQAIFKSLGPKVGNKYGASTTHMEKLLPRIEGGGGCPILAFGITSAKYVEDTAPIAELASENGDEDSE